MTGSKQLRHSPRRLMLWLLGSILVFTVFVQLPALLSYLNHCESSYDLGIYSQAIYLISDGDLNPWLTTRIIHVFNDHFDPVIILSAPFAWAFHPSIVAIASEYFYVVLAALTFFFLFKRKTITYETALFGIVLLLFNRGMVRAVSYPAHPVTWAVFPMVLLGFSLHFKNKFFIFLSLVFLLTFKEEFVFPALFTGIWFLIFEKNRKKELRFSLSIIALSIIWGVFVFWGRSKLMGDVIGYGSGSNISDQLIIFITKPWVYFQQYIEDPTMSRRIIELFVPFVPLGIWHFRHKVKPNFLICWVLLPVFGIRLITGWWFPHRAAVMAALMIFIFLPLNSHAGSHQKVLGKSQEKYPPALPRWVFVWTLLVLGALNVGDFIEARTDYLGLNPECSSNPSRIASIEKAGRILRSHKSRSPKVLAQANLIPALTDIKGIYQVGNIPDPKVKEFDWVFVEKPPSGNPWPMTHLEFSLRIVAWKEAVNTEVFIDDEHVFLAKGKFKDEI